VRFLSILLFFKLLILILSNRRIFTNYLHCCEFTSHLNAHFKISRLRNPLAVNIYVGVLFKLFMRHNCFILQHPDYRSDPSYRYVAFGVLQDGPSTGHIVYPHTFGNLMDLIMQVRLCLFVCVCVCARARVFVCVCVCAMHFTDITQHSPHI
jgi:hypothetical protein